MLTVTLYYREGCVRCDEVRQDLLALQATIPHRLVEVNIDAETALKSSFDLSIPVVEVGPYRLRSPFGQKDLQVALQAAQDRLLHYEQVGDKRFQEKMERGHTLSGEDRVSGWFANHYMLIFNLAFLIYSGAPFLAPVLMKVGMTAPAKIIYTIYSPLCHQLAFRSWFLFGEQAAYPSALAGVPWLKTYEQVTGLSFTDVLDARAFIGNEVLGYKVAYCERDVAIYCAILLFGLIFSATGRKLKSIPWYVWVVIGILPIAIDGFSQLPDLLGMNFPAWVPMRESTPFLRTLTGFLFGFFTAWYGFPLIEQSMLETRRMLAQKIAVVTQTQR